MRGSITELTVSYPHLQKHARNLMEKAKTLPTTSIERKEIQLILKDIRVLATEVDRRSQVA